MNNRTDDIAVVHPGVQHSGALAAALHEGGRLDRLYTGLQYGQDPRPPFNLAAVRRRLPRREIGRLPDRRVVRIAPAWLLASRLVARLSPVVRARLERWHEAWFSRRVASTLSPQVAAVVSTDTNSEAVFARLRAARPDVARVLDVSHPSSAVSQAMLEADASANGLDPTTYDDYLSGEPPSRAAELRLADRIIVASRFTASTLSAHVDRDTVHVVPYSVGDASSSLVDDVVVEPDRIVFVGALSERKGVTLLLRAMDELSVSGIRLELIGQPAGRYRLPDILPTGVSHASNLPYPEVLRRIARARLLVLPSMCEGFGRVLLEALAVGTPVLTTETSGGPDILERCPSAPVRVVQTGQRHHLASYIRACLDDPAFNAESAISAAAHFTDDRYRDDLVAAALGVR